MARIDDTTAALIKGMHQRGDQQYHIGVYFGLNGARVNEIVHKKRGGKKFAHVAPAHPSKLPPPGPYVVVDRAGLDTVTTKALAHAQLIEKLENLLAELRDPVVFGLDTLYTKPALTDT